ncbi:mitochondrial carrier domain-containing protein [Crepidotus variabilis]|uniref:Mitochondrial carrier domain-containing protein n=1 Tax=Crepidotus variabilis TaxID=179855 RepID=A0A9P6JPZ2_9AGAR|nr:mitochondrial carrier domain-containing protein [Crepidotus variabilis]
MNKDDVQALNPTIDFIAGTIAGMASLVVGFPFDTVKVRFQSPDMAGRYRSTAHALSTIVKEERLSGLYKGIASPLATVALMNGLVFSSYRFLMKLQLPSPESTPTLAQIALAGAGTGIITSIITTPTELIKIRQQSILTPTTARQVALQIFREAGIPGLFRGITATALRDCGYGAYFAAYEATCRYFSPPSHPHPSNLYAQAEGEMKSLSIPTLLLAGGVAGIAGWLFTFPLDVVKTRMQASPRHGLSSTTELLGKPIPSQHLDPYRTTWSTIVHSYRQDGAGVFFRGLSPTLIRAVPVNMVTFGVFEAVVHALSCPTAFCV